jgi:hypothetical protein
VYGTILRKGSFQPSAVLSIIIIIVDCISLLCTAHTSTERTMPVRISQGVPISSKVVKQTPNRSSRRPSAPSKSLEGNTKIANPCF